MLAAGAFRPHAQLDMRAVGMQGQEKGNFQPRERSLTNVDWYLGDVMFLGGCSMFPVSRPHFYNWNLDVRSCHSNFELMFTLEGL